MSPNWNILSNFYYSIHEQRNCLHSFLRHFKINNNHSVNDRFILSALFLELAYCVYYVIVSRNDSILTYKKTGPDDFREKRIL